MRFSWDVTMLLAILQGKADVIPSFIVGHYDRTGDQKLPLPRVQKTKKVGNTVQHKLVYDDDPTLDVWVPLSEYTDLGDTVSLSCKTEKDKDKRTHRYGVNTCEMSQFLFSRHSGGIFVGSWPCGIVTCFDEFWGSEGKGQAC